MTVYWYFFTVVTLFSGLKIEQSLVQLNMCKQGPIFKILPPDSQGSSLHNDNK